MNIATVTLAFVALAVIIEFIYAYQDYLNRYHSSVDIRVKRKYVKRTPEQKAADKARVRRAYHKNPSNPRWANKDSVTA